MPGLLLAAVFLVGCTAPIGADRSRARDSYARAQASPLRDGSISSYTVVVLHRYGLDGLPLDEAIPRLHEKALASGERELLYPLAELSYVAGHELGRRLKPWEPRDARDYYLGSAVYAWLFLFGEATGPAPGPFDRRFRDACDLYNGALALALAERRATNAVVLLQGGRRKLPVGELELRIELQHFPAALEDFEQFLSVDQFRVHGLSVINREPGLGAPLICAKPLDPDTRVQPTTPATMFLRGPRALSELTNTTTTNFCGLELYSPYDDTTVQVGSTSVPLEFDLTTFRAYMLNQSRIWSLGRLGFLAPGDNIKNQLLLSQPYEPDRIPVVFVHGTFSSPVTWAEMANTLIADPVIRRRYQMWTFLYASGSPLANSVADLRDALTDQVHKLDPDGTNQYLNQMVVIGHSQGGLLTKGTAIETGDRIVRLFFTNNLDHLNISETNRESLRRMMVLHPLPFVKRVVFIATPHRGSYLSGSFARRLAARFVMLPRSFLTRSGNLLEVASGSEGARFLGNRLPTSLDSMSPKNPSLIAMAEVPVSAPIKANSIIAISKGDPKHDGRDGLVEYSSAHVDYAESELIVPSFHTCLDHPATIEEVRRILHKHLKELNLERAGD
ncbi:MAG TPA: hypothetical protein VLT36_25910 [Candidatus Dormibacteraeota bacterium]|nr:hypothetical protein [Candidatus Dormibacteraeota bacterium]